jgi:hypothetical protein
MRLYRDFPPGVVVPIACCSEDLYCRTFEAVYGLCRPAILETTLSPRLHLRMQHMTRGISTTRHGERDRSSTICLGPHEVSSPPAALQQPGSIVIEPEHPHHVSPRLRSPREAPAQMPPAPCGRAMMAATYVRHTHPALLH